MTDETMQQRIERAGEEIAVRLTANYPDEHHVWDVASGERLARQIATEWVIGILSRHFASEPPRTMQQRIEKCAEAIGLALLTIPCDSTATFLPEVHRILSEHFASAPSEPTPWEIGRQRWNQIFDELMMADHEPFEHEFLEHGWLRDLSDIVLEARDARNRRAP